MIRRIGVVIAVLALSMSCSAKEGQEETTTSSAPPTAAAVTPDQARAVAKKAYIYGFPIVDNYRVMYSYFVNKDDAEYKGGWNEIHSTAAEKARLKFRPVIRPLIMGSQDVMALGNAVYVGARRQ